MKFDIHTAKRLATTSHLMLLYHTLARLADDERHISASHPILIDLYDRPIETLQGVLRRGPSNDQFPHAPEAELERIAVNLEQNRYSPDEIALLERNAERLRDGIVGEELVAVYESGGGVISLDELDAARARARGQIN